MIFALVCLSLHTTGQSIYREKRYTYFEGLPSNFIQHSFFNENHFLFCVGSKGLTMFDGYRFSPVERVSHQITAQFVKGDTLYFEDSQALKKVSVLNLSDEPITVQAKNYTDADPDNDHFHALYVDSKNRIWCHDFTQVKYVAPQGKLYTYPLFPDNKRLFNTVTFLEIAPDEVWIGTPAGIFLWTAASNRVFPHPNLNIHAILTTSMSLGPAGQVCLATTDKKLIWINPKEGSILTVLQSPHEETITGFIKHDESHLYSHSETTIWELHLRSGNFVPVHQFDQPILHVQMDSLSQQFWVGCSSGLIQLIPPRRGIRISRWDNQEGVRPAVVQSIVEDGESLLCLDNQGRLWRTTTNGDSWEQIYRNRENRTYTTLQQVDGKLLLLSNQGIFQWQNGNPVRLPIEPSATDIAPIKSILASTNEFWLLFPHNIVRYEWPSLRPISRPFKNQQSFWSDNLWNDIAVDGNGRVWLGGWVQKGYGIAYYDDRQETFVEVSDRHINPDHNKFVGDYYNRIFVSPYRPAILFTAFGGWNAVDHEGHIVQQIDATKYHFANNHLQGISEDSLGNVFFATAEGLHIYLPSRDKVDQISLWDGLPTNDLLHAYQVLQNKDIVLGIANGLVRITPKDMLSRTLSNRLAITKIMVNGLWRYPESDRIELNQRERNIMVYFSDLNYTDPNKVFYRYRISPADEWITIGNNPEISFNQLSPGDYTIDILCYDNLGFTQQKQLHISLIVPPTFVESKLFYGLLILLLIAFALAIHRYLLNRQRKEEAYKRQIKEREMQMLRAQMNPHFMFNTLNSINSYIIQNHSQDASRYLTSFSKLMRNILDNSTKQLIPLEKEIQTLRLYLELESVRLEHRFDYLIKMDSDLDLSNTCLPPMLIQPFVENAIWHGIATKKEQGTIALYFTSEEEGRLTVVISDDGIGRAKAKKQSFQKNLPSHGIKIVEERLLLHHPANRLEIHDLYDNEQQEPMGTKVILYIYFDLNYARNDY